jgi:probable HAF family extracellular repeat protein
MNRTRSHAVAALAVLAFAGLAQAQTVRFIRLGNGDADSAYSEANAISANGLVVVGSTQTSLTGESQGFYWTTGGGELILIGDLATGDLSGHVFACNADGSILGGDGATSDFPSSPEAMVWSGGTFTRLGGVIPSGFLGAGVYGMSADGAIRVGATEPSAFRSTASVWNGLVRTDLGTLGGSGTFDSSLAYGCSADGSVVVGETDSPVGRRAFRWTSAGGMVSIGGLVGSNLSVANACNADGSVIVGFSNNSNGRPEAFRWTSAGMVGLGDLPGGTFNSVATAVSADGSVVVGRGVDADHISQAFIWDATNGMRSLEAVLLSAGIDISSSFELLRATGISADGKTICGTGRRFLGGGEREAWVIQLDAPSACPCTADFDGSGGTPDAGDIDAFFNEWLLGGETADADCSGGTPDAGDIDIFFTQWLAGGC